VIRGNTIKSISDKGISVGQGSEIVAEQNVIVDCNQGFGIKDFQSFAYISQNTLYANRTGIAVFEKNTGNGGGAAQVENTIIAGSIGTSVFVDDLSTLTVSYSLSDRDTLLGYNNLHGDPGFTGAASLDFALAEGSVCINGGTPNQSDPDGTRADIGVFQPEGTPGGDMVFITELNYNSHRAFNTGDWVELYNAGSETTDLSGWVLKGQDPGDEFVFGYDAELLPGEYLVAAAQSDLLELMFPGVPVLQGDFAFGLGSGGELVRLYDADYRLVHTLQYGTGHPWPDGPNGKGATLELFTENITGSHLNGSSSNAPAGGQASAPTGGTAGSPAAWHSSYTPGGTPGMQNSTWLEVTGLTINELMAKNDFALADEAGQYDDWLEVYNSNPFAVDLGGLHFIYGEEQRVTMVPYFAGDTTVVAAGGFKLLWADKDPEQGALHLDFNLPAGGGGVGIGQVVEAGVQVIDWLSYGALGADVAFGRYPDGDVFLSFLNMTPGNSNVLLGDMPPGITPAQWEIRPNPASEYIMVDLREVRAPGRILIYSVSGGLVRAVLADQGGQILIDVSDLSPGIYMVHIQGTGLSEKLVLY
jgi:hypothetical protein